MKENIELLNYIYQTSKMNLVGIENIKPNIKDEELLKQIKKQEDNYFIICTTATDILHNLKSFPNEPSSISQVVTFIDIRISTMNDSSNRNIANLIINTNNKYILSLQEKLSKYEGKNKKIIKLAKKLLETIETSIKELNIYT